MDEQDTRERRHGDGRAVIPPEIADAHATQLQTTIWASARHNAKATRMAIEQQRGDEMAELVDEGSGQSYQAVSAVHQESIAAKYQSDNYDIARAYRS